MKILNLSAALLLFVATPSWSQTNDFANATALDLDLHNFGKSSISDVDAQYAMGAAGYVNGVADALSGVTSAEGSAFCLPAGSTHGQIMTIVLRYIDGHPEQWQYPSHQLIFAALLQVFPCPKK